LTRDQLTAVGEALYGLRWQAALSRDLNVALRTVQRWDAGERGIPDTLSDDLRALLEQRRIDIDDLLKSI
jgi:hypothetical protein